MNQRIPATPRRSALLATSLVLFLGSACTLREPTLLEPPPVQMPQQAPRQDLPAPPLEPAPPELALDTVSVFYGTNRTHSTVCAGLRTATWDGVGPCMPADYYVAQASSKTPDLEVGRITVTLPPDHETGQIERPPTFLSFELRDEDPGKDVVLSRLVSYGEDYEAWSDSVRQQRKDQAFIYVHGYATSFRDAALRAGQVAADLDFDQHGVPMFFSWPSVGDTNSYGLDYEVSVLATDAFNQFLDLVHEKTGIVRVHVIAHSMGNRVVANALRDREQRGEASQLIDQLILAAPDIHADTFRRRFLDILPGFAQRVTLYVSDKDVALQVSETLRRANPRAGQRRGGLLAAEVDRFDPVDATDLDTDFLSHSYYANHASMLSDIYCVLRGAIPELRPLVEPGDEGWRFGTLRADEVDAGACPDASPVESGNAD